jgi:hypothetical protein
VEYSLQQQLSSIMDIGPALWLFMTLGGAALLGAGLAYGLISTSRRRKNPMAQRVTEAGTRDVYHAEEERRADIEDEGTAVAARSGREIVTATEARQGVVGHHVIVVLMVSLFLAVLAALGLYAYHWV